MNIILLGYRGTGKSVISRLLARQLKCPLFSLDSMIEEAVGIPIPEIVSMWGWARFREIESKIVEQAVEEAKDAVIDCGGGVVLNPRNIQKLKENGRHRVKLNGNVVCSSAKDCSGTKLVEWDCVGPDDVIGPEYVTGE